jgi:hypothetical protein
VVLILGCKGGFTGCGFYHNHSVNLFTSTNLVDWTSHGNVLPEENRVDRILFSPKVLYNAKNKEYVLWYNYVPSYSYGVATSVSPFGPFQTVNTTAGASFRFGYPNNSDIGDFSVWVDDDGTGYFLYSAHAHCQVEQLTDDYLASTWSTTKEGSEVFPHGNEAPALFKRGNLWYSLVSTSCCYCQAGGKVHAYSSTNPLGPYKYLGEIAGGPNPFGGDVATSSQQTNVFPMRLAGSNGSSINDTTFMWQGDRWQSALDKLKSHDFTFWEPLKFAEDGSIEKLVWADWFTCEGVSCVLSPSPGPSPGPSPSPGPRPSPISLRCNEDHILAGVAQEGGSVTLECQKG